MKEKVFLMKFRNFFSLVPKIAPWVMLAGIICVYLSIEISNFTPAYTELDPEGYLLPAKRIACGEPLSVKDDDIFYYQNHVWVENEKGEVCSKFAPGYPVIMALFYKIGGDVGMFWVSPFCGVLALIGAFFLFRLWMSSFPAILATACLAVNKMFLIYTGYLLTHSLDICAVVWGIYFLFKWRRNGKWQNALYTGLILGFACTVRYTDALFTIVILIAVISRLIPYLKEVVKYKKRDSKDKEESLLHPGYRPLISIGVLLGAFALFPLIMLIYNKVLFGNSFVTGYYLSNEQYAFSFNQITKTLPAIWNGMSNECLFLTFEIGLIAILLLGPWSESLMKIFWVAPLILLHATYYWTGGSMAYTRFFISLYPAFIGSAFALIDKVLQSKVRRWFIATLFAAMVIGGSFNDAMTGISRVVSFRRSRAVAECAKQLSSSLNPNAVIFSDWKCGTYLGTLRQFRYYNLYLFTSQYGKRSGWGINVRQQKKRVARLREFYRTHNQKELSAMKKKLVLKFLSEGRQVVFLINPARKKHELLQLGNNYSFTSVPGFETEGLPFKKLRRLGLFELQTNK